MQSKTLSSHCGSISGRACLIWLIETDKNTQRKEPMRRKARRLWHGSDIFSVICVLAVGLSPFPAGFTEEEDMASVLQGSAFFSSVFLKLLWPDLKGLQVKRGAHQDASQGSPNTNGTEKTHASMEETPRAGTKPQTLFLRLSNLLPVAGVS